MMAVQTNPFWVGTEIRHPTDFVGRKDILRAISGAMSSLQSVSLHGERRTGKTSLLLYLAHPDAASKIQLAPTHIPVYFNFQGVTGDNDVAGIWQDLADAIAEQIELRLPNGTFESARFLATVERSCQKSGLIFPCLTEALSDLGNSGFKVHLLFDEFEQTGNCPNLGDSFYDALRSLPTRTKNISYVIATRTGLATLQPTYNKISSPFFNIFTTLTLEPFQEQDVHDLIINYLTRSGQDLLYVEKLSDESDFLYDATGYHPFFLQALCHHLYNQLHEPDWPRGKAKCKALEAFGKDSESHFDYYWEVSSKEEQELMVKLATEQYIDWEYQNPIKRQLVDRCLIVQREFGWRLFSFVFSDWLKTRQLVIWHQAGIDLLAKGSYEKAQERFQEIQKHQPNYRDTEQRLEEIERKLDRDRASKETGVDRENIRKFVIIVGVGVGIISLLCVFVFFKSKVTPIPQLTISPTLTMSMTSPKPTTVPTPTLTAAPVNTLPPTPTFTVIPTTPSPSATPTDTATRTLTPAFTEKPTITPSSTPRSTPTPQVVMLDLIVPLPGGTYKNPVEFKWKGVLNPGQVYRVTLRHSDSDYYISEQLTIESWTRDLPGELFGEWFWQIEVVANDEIVVVSSKESQFWFNPFSDGATPPPDTATPPPFPLIRKSEVK